MNDLLQLLWANNTATGRAIIVLIFALGAIGALCALWHRSRYAGVERRWLEKVRGNLRRAREAREAAPAGDAATASAPIIQLHELAEGVPAWTLIGDRLHTLQKMKKARAKVNTDALQQTTMLKESARFSLALPAYIVSLVMMLGLLGTFIGLSWMVVDIQAALPGSNGNTNPSQWAESVSSLGRILAGKKTAFSATLAGLFFSIVVSALNFGLARAQSELYDALERFTAEDLLPGTIPAFDDETPWEKLSLQLGDSFDRLQELTGSQARSVEQIAAVERAFGTIIENIEKITHRAATAPLQGMAGEMTTVIGQLTEVNGSIVTLTSNLPQIVSSFRQTQGATLREIQTVMQSQQAGLERLALAIQAGGMGAASGKTTFIAAVAAAVLLIVFLLQWLR